MSDSVNALASTVTAALQRGSSNAAPAPKTETAPAASVTHTAPAHTTAISPRIQVDPQAGVIIQFLDSDGNVQDQLPSTASVAYRRLGLEGDGSSKKPDVPTDSVVA